MKLFSLIRAQFSRGYLREALLGMQLAVMLCLMAPIMSDVAELMSINRLASQMTSPAFFFQASSRYLVPDDMELAEYTEMLERVENLAEVEAVGRMAVGTTGIDGVSTAIRFYNDALLSRVRLPVRQKQEISLVAGQVAVLIDAKMAQRYPVGTVIQTVDVYFPISCTHQTMEMVVVGVMETDGYFYAFMGGASQVSLNALGARNDGTAYNMVALQGFSQAPVQDVAASCLLFVDRENESICDAVNTTVSGDGLAVTISSMKQNSLREVVSQQPMIFLAALLMTLLCVTGIITYVWLTMQDFMGRFGMYFTCGMTRGRGLAVLLGVHLLPMLLGISAALVALNLMKLGVTGEGITLSLLLMVPQVVFCLVIIALRFQTAEPILQLRRGE